MAIVKAFNDAVLKEKRGVYSQSDVWQLVFLSNTYASVDTDVVDPVLGDYTAVSGGNVAATYTLGSATINRVTNTVTFDAADIGTITKNASNPVDIRTAMLINSTVTNDAIQVWDLTADGVTATPIDLINNDFNFTFGANGINYTVNQSA